MSRSNAFALFGTAFDDLEDDAGVVKKPLRIEDQIVTDENGRQRFHGAFTGGFSAGYYNTVGTKEGWTPSTFKSTHSNRAQGKAQRPEDFMDAEDFSEYGIAPKRIRTTHKFTDAETNREQGRKENRLAWETTAVAAEADLLSELIKPASDSIGVRLLVAMGWRPGKGIGALQSAKARERMNVDTVKGYGCELPPELMGSASTSMADVGQVTADFQYSPDDIDFIKFEPKSDLHGLGYQSLQVEKRTERSSVLKVGKSGPKGIRGQAFGVGAFEEDDADIYVAEDISSYDFVLGDASAPDRRVNDENEFAMSDKQQTHRQFFAPPKLPRDYTPARPFASKALKKQTHDEEKKSSEAPTRTATERAHRLGESSSVWSLVSEKDRQRIEASKVKTPKPEVKVEPRSKVSEKDPTVDPSGYFPQDAKKQARFVEFINCTKRGFCMPQPIDLTEWDWDSEQVEFRKLLPKEFNQMADETKDRHKPLANPDVAATFRNAFQLKFTHGNYDDAGTSKARDDEDKVKAVQMKMFGQLTREKHEWHPDKVLCKRFNVPNPYPDSREVGVPYLKRKPRQDFGALQLTTPSEATKSSERRETREYRDEKQIKTEIPDEPPSQKRPHSEITYEDVEKPSVSDAPVAIEEEIRRPPMDLFKSVFAETSSSSESENEDQPTTSTIKQEPQSKPVTVPERMKPQIDHSVSTERRSFTESIQRQAVITADVDIKSIKVETITVVESTIPVVDLADDTEEVLVHGPALPPSLETSTGFSSILSKRHSSKKSKKRSKKEKRKKHKKRSEKEKKSRKHHSSDDDRSSSSGDSPRSDRS